MFKIIITLFMGILYYSTIEAALKSNCQIDVCNKCGNQICLDV